VEKDEKTLACAKHNAEVYGVSKKIFWIHGDIFEVLQKRLKSALKKAVVFGSPPWGGMFKPTLQSVTKTVQLTRDRPHVHRLRGLRPGHDAAIRDEGSIRTILGRDPRCPLPPTDIRSQADRTVRGQE